MELGIDWGVAGGVWGRLAAAAASVAWTLLGGAVARVVSQSMVGCAGAALTLAGPWLVGCGKVNALMRVGAASSRAVSGLPSENNSRTVLIMDV